MLKIKNRIITTLLLFVLAAGTITPITADAADGTATVYITDTGSKYHADGCRSLKKSKIATTLQKAVDTGYTACKLCHPGTVAKSSATSTATTTASTSTVAGTAATTGTATATASIADAAALQQYLATVNIIATTVTAVPAEFDASYYALTYPDVVTIMGTDDATILYAHYLTYGITEGRFPSAAAALTATKTKK